MPEALILNSSAHLSLTLGQVLPESLRNAFSPPLKHFASALVQNKVTNTLCKLLQVQALNHLKPAALLVAGLKLVDHFHEDPPLLLKSMARAEALALL